MHMTFVYSVSFRDTWIHFRFEKGSFCSIFNFLCSILLVIICFCFYFVLSFCALYYLSFFDFRRSSWSWSYDSWIYNYVCNQCQIPLMLWVRIPLRQCVLDTTLCDKVCQWLAIGRWFSPGTLVSSTNKTGLHDITEILLKVALNSIPPSSSIYSFWFSLWYLQTFRVNFSFNIYSRWS